MIQFSAISPSPNLVRCQTKQNSCQRPFTTCNQQHTDLDKGIKAKSLLDNLRVLVFWQNCLRNSFEPTHRVRCQPYSDSQSLSDLFSQSSVRTACLCGTAEMLKGRNGSSQNIMENLTSTSLSSHKSTNARMSACAYEARTQISCTSLDNFY